MKAEQRVFIDGTSFRDASGRTLLFRGCNLGGDSKLPIDPSRSPADLSFVGRPFPESEADTHFERLSGWGFTIVRLVITWEAVEHAGPGVYDEEYLSYLRAIIKSADRHGVLVLIDPHQDAWSRATGGSGAPAWTLEALGFDLSRLEETGAAVRSGPSWPLNYARYAAATMFTLFFAGNTFAPGRHVEGVPVQEWLQGHFIDAMRHAARRLKDCGNLVGFGTLNEPHPGFIGLPSLDSRSRMLAERGTVPTAFEAMTAASGFPVAADRFRLFGLYRGGPRERINLKGLSLFREGFTCPWREAGVWSIQDGKPVVLRDNWFARGDFASDYLKAFQARFMAELSRKHEHYVFFTEGVPLGPRAQWPIADRVRSDGTPLHIAEAFHWYEGFLLMTKKWRPWLCSDALKGSIVFGKRRVKRSVRRQFMELAAMPRAEGIPALVGEFGIPFDMNRGRAYQDGNWSSHEAAFALNYEALDAAMLHSFVWNYSASNTQKDGDGWNSEDLSIWNAASPEGRAVRGFSRPWPVALSGVPRAFSFEPIARVFTLEWEGLAGISEVFVPAHWYPEGWRAEFAPEDSGQTVLEEAPDRQRLFVNASSPGRCRVRIGPLRG